MGNREGSVPVMRFLERRRMLAVVAVSENSAGSGTGNAFTHALANGAVSADGRYVVFSSTATNLLSGGANSKDQILRRDLSTEKTALVSVASNGTSVGNGGSFDPIVSADGRFVAF